MSSDPNPDPVPDPNDKSTWKRSIFGGPPIDPRIEPGKFNFRYVPEAETSSDPDPDPVPDPNDKSTWKRSLFGGPPIDPRIEPGKFNFRYVPEAETSSDPDPDPVPDPNDKSTWKRSLFGGPPIDPKIKPGKFNFGSMPKATTFSKGCQTLPEVPHDALGIKKALDQRDEYCRKWEECEKKCTELEIELDIKDEARVHPGFIHSERVPVPNPNRNPNNDKQVNMSSEEKIEELKALNAKLLDDLENANSTIIRAEEGWKQKSAELEGLHKKTAENEHALQKAKLEIDDKEATIEAITKQLYDADQKTETFQAQIVSVQDKFDTGKTREKAEKDRADGFQRLANDRAADNQGINSLLDSTNEELRVAKTELVRLRINAALHQETLADLREAREKNAALKAQLLKLTVDSQQNAFDLRPGAYRTANPDGIKSGRKTLDDELAGLGGSLEALDDSEHTDSEGSQGKEFREDESDDENDLKEGVPAPEEPSPKPIIQDDDETKKPTVTSGPQNQPTKGTLDPVILYTPFQVSAHNPILCWLQVELNFLTIFSYWVSKTFGICAYYTRRAVGTPNLVNRGSVSVSTVRSNPTAVSSNKPTSPATESASTAARSALQISDAAVRAEQIAGQLFSPVPDESLLRETLPAGSETLLHSDIRTTKVAATRIPTAASDQATTAAEGSQSAAQTGGAPVISSDLPASADIEERIGAAISVLDPLTDVPDNREAVSAGSTSVGDTAAVQNPINSKPGQAWHSQILSPNSGDMPAFMSTVFGLLFHIAVYFSIFLSISAAAERNRWIAANDSTRTFLLDVLEHHGRFQNGLSWIIFALPEGWKHSIDVFIWKALIEKLNLQVIYQMPG